MRPFCTACAAQVLSIYSNLSGVLFIAFLFGDLTNILCNLDPAMNEFKRTVDNMNKFAAGPRKGATVSPLREGSVSSESLEVSPHSQRVFI